MSECDVDTLKRVSFLRSGAFLLPSGDTPRKQAVVSSILG